MILTRRRYLAGVGLLAATGIAGCADATAEPGPGPSLDVEPEYHGWFDGVDAYDGTHDRRGQTTVPVVVGASGGMGYYRFAPAAVAVSPGTTVTWTWSGKGGGHNVVAVDETFASSYTRHAGETFTYTFETPGVYPYHCEPHAGMGMKGAIVVVE